MLIAVLCLVIVDVAASNFKELAEQDDPENQENDEVCEVFDDGDADVDEHRELLVDAGEEQDVVSRETGQQGIARNPEDEVVGGHGVSTVGNGVDVRGLDPVVKVYAGQAEH